MRDERRFSLKTVLYSVVIIIIIINVSFGICAGIAIYEYVPYRGQYSIRAVTNASGPFTLILPVITNSTGAPIKDILKTHLDKNITSIALKNTQYGPTLEINASGDFIFSYNKKSKARDIFSNISMLIIDKVPGAKFHVYYNATNNGSVNINMKFSDSSSGLILGGRYFYGSIAAALAPGWHEAQGSLKKTIAD
jgi:hypothetical protein